MVKLKNIKIKDTVVSITELKKEDYICLTDMAKAKTGDNRAADFKVVEFDHFISEMGLSNKKSQTLSLDLTYYNLNTYTYI